jgi:hypothetical protein
MMDAHYQFFDAAGLRLDGDKLVFCEDCHAGCVFAVGARGADPTILSGQEGTGKDGKPWPVDWENHERVCSDWIEITIYLQALFGGCAHAPVLHDPNPSILRKLSASWERSWTMMACASGARTAFSSVGSPAMKSFMAVATASKGWTS